MKYQKHRADLTKREPYGKRHASGETGLVDVARTRMLNAHRIQVLRFENIAVLANPGIVLEAISAVCSSAMDPSP